LLRGTASGCGRSTASDGHRLADAPRGTPLAMQHPTRSRLARTAFGGFLILAAAIAALASFTMFVTEPVLASIWTTKERSYHQLLQHKVPVGLGFAALAVILALAAAGWARHKRW